MVQCATNGRGSMNENTITAIFRDVDDFHNKLEAYCKVQGPPAAVRGGNGMVPERRPGTQRGDHHSDPVRLSGYRCFKWFYGRNVPEPRMAKYFPKAVSYGRFVELMRYSLMPTDALRQVFLRGKGHRDKLHRLDAP